MEWLTLNWLDYIILVVVGLSVVISLMRGLVRESLSLTTWVLAVWLAIKFYLELAEVSTPIIQSETIRSGASFLLIFIVVLIVGTIFSYTIARLVHKTGLSGTDRLLGGVFGFARGVFLMAVLLLVIELFDEPQPDQQQWLEASHLAGYFLPVTEWLIQRIPQSLDQSSTLVFEQESIDYTQSDNFEF